MRIRLSCGIVALLGVFSAVDLHAQDTGAITGTVRDNTGAVIQGVDVKISGIAGGIERDTTTNADGDYSEAGLPGGTYNLTITAKGFKTFKGKGVVLRVGQKARVDAALAVGDIATEIVVQGEDLNQVETQSSDLAGTVTGKQITQLELNGRNYTQLLALTPGATNQSGNDEAGVGLNSVTYSVNGGRTEYNNWEVDGGNNMDDGSNTTLMTFPSLDAIAEVRVLSSNYGAQYGRNSSGTVEVETKSGTNTFHGDAYEFVRNDAFNARNYFAQDVPPYKKNDWGYTLGGPVFIPGHYNQDRSKTFFFFSEEWRRDHISQLFNQTVPSCAERGLVAGAGSAGCTGTQSAVTQGDFSELCPGTMPPDVPGPGPDCPINPSTGLPFGNPLYSGSGAPTNPVIVPIDPHAIPLLGMFPYPTGGSPGNWSYNASVPAPENFREELFRIDHNINSKLHASVRYIHDSWNAVSPVPLWTGFGNFNNSYPTIQDSYAQPSTSLVVHLTATLTPTLLNEFVASYSVNHITMQLQGPAWKRQAPDNTLGLFPTNGGKLFGFGLGGGLFDGTFEDPGYIPQGPVNSNPSYTYRDNVSKIVGKHNLQFGGYFVASQKNELPQAAPSLNGNAVFSTSAPGSTGDAFADLLTGNIKTFQQASSEPKYYLRYKIFEPYFQDDWHVSNHLTLNLGLRISLFGTVYDNNKQVYNFDPSKYDSSPGATFINADGTVGGAAGPFQNGLYNGMVQCGVGGVPTGCAKGHLFNPAPRIGFAYDVFGDGKTAIRGGYGIFFEHTNGNEAVATQLEGSPPFVQNPAQQNIQTTFNPDGSIATSGYLGVGGNVGAQFPQSVTEIPQRQIWPYVQQWHFDIEHQLPAHIVGIVSYVGSKGTHLGRRQDVNALHSVAAQGLTNPYKVGEAIGPNDCANGTTPSGAPITGYNTDGVPGDQSGIGINMFVACGGNPDFFRPYLGYSDIRSLSNAASSSYNGLQLSGRRTVGDLQLTASYTYSHSIDDASSSGDNTFVNSYNFAGNRADSNFDERHVFTLSYIYDLPFFKSAGLTHTLLGGWQWSGITSFQTGTPFTVLNGGTSTTPSDNAGVADGIGSGSYPDLAGNPNSSAGSVAPPNSFGPLLVNPTAFVAPRGLTFGNSPRNVARNPNVTNFDMAIFKHFAIKERVAIEFRAEAFNVFNHTEWGYIAGGSGGAGSNSNSNTGGSASVSCYGGATLSAGDQTCVGPSAPVQSSFLRPGAAHNPRFLQLGMKFIF
jgi:Carboxypeptidase regulatory-like domain/TonB-dependent Receptor Plug Domain